MFTYVCTHFTVPVTAGSVVLISDFAPLTWRCAMIRFDSKSETVEPRPLFLYHMHAPAWSVCNV